MIDYILFVQSIIQLDFVVNCHGAMDIIFSSVVTLLKKTDFDP